MSTKLSSTGWLCLGLALAAAGMGLPAAAEIRPSSDLLLPYFEVDFEEPGRATLFAVCNGSERPAEVVVTVLTNWGIPVLEVVRTIRAEAVLTVNLRDWIIDGKLPDRALGASDLAHLQAALSGQRSPRDQLYYSTSTAPGRAVGSVTMRTRGAVRPDALWGDYFVADPLREFAQGETLVNIDPSLECTPACTRHGVRFLEGGTFDAGTEVLIWTDRRGTPSSTPEPALRLELESEVYDEAGRVIDERHLRHLPVEMIQVGKLGLSKPFGWLDLTTQGEAFVGVRFSAGNLYSVALHSYCLPAKSLVEGPGLEIRKLTNGVRATRPPGPSIPVGSDVVWDYVVTNTGDVPLTGITVFDDHRVLVQCPQSELDPGESMTCAGHDLAVACQYSNTATATGTPPSGPDVSATDIAHYTGVPHAAIDIETATNGEDADDPPGPSVQAGTTVSWTYTVTNTGDVPLTGVTVTDDHDVAVSCPKAILPPGKSMTCTASGVAVAGQYRNVGTARGVPPCGEAVSDDDASHYMAPGGGQVGDQGCTPGYWKNHPAAWPPAGYSPDQAVVRVFPHTAGYPGLGSATLLEALGFGGGGGLDGAARNLLRAGVAALLNAAHPQIAYPRDPAGVAAEIDAALASGNREAMLALAAGLDADNNLGCPLS